MLQVLAITRDLLFMSKLKTVLQNLPPENGESWSGYFARNEADFRQRLAQGGIEVVLVDTQAIQFDWESLIREAHQAGVPVLAFGSHMQPAPLLKARQAGAYKAVANSAITQKPGELLAARHSAPGQPPSPENFEVEE
jgi:DNA-binding NarL/FixJ family response regulator